MDKRRGATRAGRLIRALPLIVTLVLAACAGRSTPPPSPGYELGGIPDLRGARVILLPVQLRVGAHPDVGREIEYALGRIASDIDWVMPPALRDMMAQSPGTGVQIEGLPVGIFLTREVERIGDPLFGSLYRLAAMASAPLVLLPVEARAREYGDLEAVGISTALVEARSGRVLWFGIVEGDQGPAGSLAAAASAAEALARRIVVP